MRILTTSFVVLSLLVVSANAEAGTYMLSDDWGGSWADADKDTTSSEDDLLCWAASAANMLEWTGWGDVGGMSTCDDMLDYFEGHWTDVAGHPHVALNWWFTGSNYMDGESGWAQVDVAGGGFYPTQNVNDVLAWRATAADAMDSIDELLHDGYATSIWVGGGGHFLTVWGYEYNDASGAFEGIYVTDSDDDKGGPPPRTDSLVYYDVTWYDSDSVWKIDDYGNYQIGGVTGLKLMSVVPLPASAWLGLGLLGGLGVIRRMRCRRAA